MNKTIIVVYRLHQGLVYILEKVYIEEEYD